MKITNFQIKTQTLEARVNFRIALTDHDDYETIYIKLSTDTGLVGFGEAKPFFAVTGETIPGVLSYLEAARKVVIGANPFELEKIHQKLDNIAVGNTAAKAAIDIALYDICAQTACLPLYQYLGGSENQVFSDVTIGIDPPETMAGLARKYKEEKFTMLKVKVGLNDENDLEAIRLIRESTGNDMQLRLDANQGWSAKQACRMAKSFEAYNVLEIEQPVPYRNLAALKWVKDHTSMAIMADEAVHSPEDAFQVVKAEAADIVNIKLMKSAGIFPALAINAICEAAGINCMVGCMSESLVAIAAGAALVAAKSNITYADLDGHLLIKDVPGLLTDIKQEGSCITLPDDVPGLGVIIKDF